MSTHRAEASAERAKDTYFGGRHYPTCVTHNEVVDHVFPPTWGHFSVLHHEKSMQRHPAVPLTSESLAHINNQHSSLPPPSSSEEDIFWMRFQNNSAPCYRNITRSNLTVRMMHRDVYSNLCLNNYLKSCTRISAAD